MTDKKKVLLDPSFRSIEMIFTPEDLARLHSICDVVWGEDEPIPHDVFPKEPLPKEHAIRRAPGTVLSAHRAGSVAADLRLIGRMVVDDLESMIAGLPPMAMQIAQPEIVFRLE